ncbi:hypothetical protein [Corynebacterium halotolerans]|uniref:hypothetical protein n=1 Tax=Corynebacterium halotolerans TaxID=225326 RepID=UPI003CF0B82D
MSGIITLILGIIALVGGVWLVAEVGASVMAIVGGLIIALGVSLIIAAWALLLNKVSPTSRKLGR